MDRRPDLKGVHYLIYNDADKLTIQSAGRSLTVLRTDGGPVIRCVGKTQVRPCVAEASIIQFGEDINQDTNLSRFYGRLDQN